MSGWVTWLRGLALVAAIGLAGCEEGATPFAGQGASSALAGRIVERDLEDPTVFEAKEPGLWDGRPSLGGVWVAYPDVQNPERVMIRNPANGKSVVGALFRRERENPGPRLQVSSDAAEALGILAGQPSELTVVALRRVEDPVPGAAPGEPAAEDAGTAVAGAAPADGSAATDTAGPGDATVAAAAAAIDAAEAGTSGAELAADAAPEPPRRRGFLGGLFGPRQERTAAETTDEAPSGTDVGVPGALPETPAVTAEALPAPGTPAPAAATAAASPSQPFIQIGIFSVEANANRAADQMRAAGLIPSVRETSSSGKVFWRVLIGPASNTAEREQLLGKVKSLGYQDAYFVRS